MKKLIYVLIFVLLAAGAAACGQKEGEAPASANTETRQEVKEEGKTETGAAASAAESNDKIWLYGEDAELVEVPMGDCVNGVQTEFCKIKVPVKGKVWLLGRDEEGEAVSIAESKSIKDILAEGLPNQERVPAKIGMVVLANQYDFDTAAYDATLEQSIKEQLGDLIEIDAPEGCECYVTTKDEYGTVYVVFNYKNEWLLWSYIADKELAAARTEEEIAKQVIKMITE